MDTNLVHLANTIRNTKCNVCNLVVSVAPVMIISENEQHRCGRCNVLKCTTFARNVFYENMAMHVKFPCIYANCEEDIPWGEVENHEKVCPFRTITCPLYYQGNCKAVLEIAKLRSHFEAKHQKNIQHGCINFTMTMDGGDVVFLLIVDDVQFFVYILHSSNHRSAVVFLIHPTDKFSKYDVILSTTNNNIIYSMSCRVQEIIGFVGRDHCFKCYKDKCYKKHHPNSQAYPHNKQKLDLRGLGSQFGKSSTLELLKNTQEITCTINLVSNKLEQTKGNTGQPNKDTLLDKTGEGLVAKCVTCCSNNVLFRQNLECPICKEYMLVPIYTCKTGHTICNVCKSQLPNCPYCEEEITEARNYALEHIAESIELSCQWDKQGCTFTGNVERLREHEANCSHKIKS